MIRGQHVWVIRHNSIYENYGAFKNLKHMVSMISGHIRTKVGMHSIESICIRGIIPLQKQN